MGALEWVLAELPQPQVGQLGGLVGSEAIPVWLAEQVGVGASPASGPSSRPKPPFTVLVRRGIWQL